MSGPWEDYQTEDGPWTDYGSASSAGIGLKGIAKAAGVGAGEGAIGLAGAPGDLLNLASKILPEGSQAKADFSRIGEKIGSQSIKKAVEGYTGEFYQPQNTAEKYANTIGSFLPAVLGGPEGLATKLATRAIIPGVASEAAGQATEGTALEPVARVAGALTGAAGASAAARGLTKAPASLTAPTLDQLQSERTALYGSPEIKAVQFKPRAMEDFVSSTDQALLQAKVDKFVAPTVDGILQRLKSPRFGPAGTVDDFELARRALSDVPYNESRAAGIVRGAIDRKLGTVQQGELLAGDAAAANAKLLDARATHAAIKRSEDVTNALGRAENQAGSTHSGANIENATRQQLKPLLNQKTGVSKSKAFEDYTDAEIAALRRAVNGTPYGNAVRTTAKYLGGGGGLGGVAAGAAAGGAAHESGASPLQSIATGLAAAVAGRILNRHGANLATNRVNQLDELLRSRSPLAQRMGFPAGGGQPLPQVGGGGLLSQLPPAQQQLLLGLLSSRLNQPAQ
jgi:hypothetical protein